MWNFNEQIKTNDIEEICAILNLYKDKWLIVGDYDAIYLKVETAIPKTDKQFVFIGDYIINNELKHSTKSVSLWLSNWFQETEYKVLFV